MIFCTGDCHGEFRRFNRKYFPERETMSREDYVIICGDFGGVWNGGERDQIKLDWLEDLPFTTLFVDGNHEGYDELKKYSVEEWHGGKVQKIRAHVIHLMRGQVYDIDGYTFFTMGGASSHDIEDGILDPDDPAFYDKYLKLSQSDAMFRVNHMSWWKEELPDDEEYGEARKNLERVGYDVDFILTHCAPSSIVDILSGGQYGHDRLTDFLEEVKRKTSYNCWLFGHYHKNEAIDDKHILLYEQIVQIA